MVTGVGSVSGIFNNPQPGSATYDGVGTSSFQWGEAVPGSTQSSLQFTGQSFNVGVGDSFVLGTILFHNGTIYGGTGADSVTLSFTTTGVSSRPDLFDFNQSLDLTINLINSPNVAGDPIASADFIYFPDYPAFGSFRVFEDQETTVELLASFGSLDFKGFGKVGDPTIGFLSSSVVVPEPGGIGVVVGLGLLGLAAQRQLRTRR